MTKPNFDLNQLKLKLIHINKRSLFKYVLYGITTITLVLTFLIYLNSNFSDMPKILESKKQGLMLYQAHSLFHVAFILGLVLIILIELVALWQKKMKQVNDLSFCFLISGYGVGLIYLFFSFPLTNFLNSYLNNKDPFKSFSQSFQIVQKINVFFFSLSIVVMLFLFILTYLTLLAKAGNIQLNRVKLKKREAHVEHI